MHTLWNKLSKPSQEAVKEFFRVILLAVIPVIIGFLAVPLEDARVMVITTLTIGATAGLRFVDKWLHETGKEYEKNVPAESPLTGGLTRF